MIHTSVRSPHSFTIICPPAQALPAGHVPLARLLRLTPEDRTFPAPVKAGRVGHECDMLSRPPDLFGSKKRSDPWRCPRLEPVPDIKIPWLWLLTCSCFRLSDWGFWWLFRANHHRSWTFLETSDINLTAILVGGKCMYAWAQRGLLFPAETRFVLGHMTHRPSANESVRHLSGPSPNVCWRRNFVEVIHNWMGASRNCYFWGDQSNGDGGPLLWVCCHWKASSTQRPRFLARAGWECAGDHNAHWLRILRKKLSGALLGPR